MIEFYGEVTDYTKRRTDKLRKRYFSNWLFALALIVFVVALVLLITAAGLGWLYAMIFAVLLAAAGAFFRFGPMKKNFNKAKWLFRVQIEGDRLTWVQYLPDKTIRKKKNLNGVKKVYRTKYCYYIVFNDIANAVVCERCLLKRGTFERFEYTFEGKIRNLEI